MNVWNALAEKVVDWLVATSWQAAVLAILVIVVQRTFRRMLNARWRYLLWLLVIGRLLIPALPESPTSLYRYLPPSPVAAIPDESGVPPLITSQPAGIFPSPAPAPEMPALTQATPMSAKGLLLVVWSTGFLALAVSLASRHFRFRRSILRGCRSVNDETRELASSVACAMGVSHRFEVVEAPSLETPAVVGVFSPKLLLPCDFTNRLSREELGLIFRHELAHLQRGDLWINFLVCILQIVHWFNPVLWYAFGQMRHDRELATDALALSAMIGAHEVYGETLVKLAAGHLPNTSLAPAIGILENHRHIRERVKQIAGLKPNAYGWSSFGMTIFAVLALLMLTKAPSLASIQANRMIGFKSGTSVVVTETKELVGDVGRIYHAIVYTQTGPDAPKLGPVSYQFIADMSNNTFPVTGGSVSLPPGSGWATNPVTVVNSDLLVGAHYLYVQGFKSEANLLGNFPYGQYAFNIQPGATGPTAHTVPVQCSGSVPYPPIAPIITNKAWKAGYLVLDPASAEITFTNYPGATLTWEIVIPGRTYIMSAGGGGTSVGALNLTGLLSYGQTYDAQLRFINRDKSSTVNDPGSPKNYGYSTMMGQIVEFKIKTPPGQGSTTSATPGVPSNRIASPPSPRSTGGSLAEMVTAMQDHAHSIAPTKQRLQILQGFYGADGSWRDVTSFLQKLVKGTSLQVLWQQPYTEIGGDPAWLKVKTLVISYRLDGRIKLRSFEEKNPPIGLQASLP